MISGTLDNEKSNALWWQKLIMHLSEDVRMGSALPIRKDMLESMFIMGPGLQGLFFLVVPPLPQMYKLCILWTRSDYSGHTAGMYDLEWVRIMAVRLSWDVQSPMGKAMSVTLLL